MPGCLDSCSIHTASYIYFQLIPAHDRGIKRLELGKAGVDVVYSLVGWEASSRYVVAMHSKPFQHSKFCLR